MVPGNAALIIDTSKKTILNREGSHPKYSAMPPQTPAIILLFDLTKALFIYIFFVLNYCYLFHRTCQKHYPLIFNMLHTNHTLRHVHYRTNDTLQLHKLTVMW